MQIYAGFLIAGLLVTAGFLLLAPWAGLIAAGACMGLGTFLMMEESSYEED